jgi:hypothetical protein
MVSTTRPADPTSAVLAAYQQFWRVWLEANDPPNPNDPNLQKVDTGAQLAGAKATISEHLRRGQVVRLPAHSRYRHTATATLAGGTTEASVIDCAIDDSQLLDGTTGRILDGTTETQLIYADMQLLAGRWKVSGIRFMKKWQGVRRCND